MNEERRAKNREAVKKWKAAHPDKVKEYQRQYHLKHLDQRLSYYRQYHRSVREKARKYDELNKEGAEE